MVSVVDAVLSIVFYCLLESYAQQPQRRLYLPVSCGGLPHASASGRTVLTPTIDERLRVLLAEQSERWGQELIELEVLPDPVQLLVGWAPQCGLHRLVKLLKGYSSHALRTAFAALKRRLPSLWTSSSFVATVGGVTLETLKRYVEHQKGT